MSISTTLDTLLEYLGARTLILAGIAANNCVLFTAHDAYLRDFDLIVLSDCVASIRPADNRHALRQMQGLLKAQLHDSRRLIISKLARPRAGR